MTYDGKRADAADRATVNAPDAGFDADRGLPLWGLVSLSAAPAVAYGLSRFAYALILPPMKADLGLTYAEAGAINTANNIGYLAGAVLAFLIVRQSNAKKAFVLGIVLTGLSLCVTGLFDDLGYLLFIRTLNGVPAAVALVAGGFLASHAGGTSKIRSSLALNIYYCGGGLGIILSTTAALPILPESGYGAWPTTWLLLGAITIVSVLPALYAFRLLPIPRVAAKTVLTIGIVYRTGLLNVALAYLFFGLGYIGYMTFIIAHLRESAVGAGEIALFWVVVGVSSSVGAFAWTPVFSKLSGPSAMATVMATIGCGALIPIIDSSLTMTVASAILFGSTFLSVVAAVNYAVRTRLPAERWAAAIAVMTVVVGIGQSVGPILVGWLSEMGGGLAHALIASPLFLFVGAVLAASGNLTSKAAVQLDQAG